MNWTIRPLLIALQFLTRLPLGIRCEYNDRAIGRSLLYYPSVGLFIGALLALAAWTLNFTAASSFITAAIVLTSWVLVTGGLHIDGLADSADAWIGGYGDRDKTLAIMKDPCCGPAAVMLVVLVLILKCAALEHILAQYFHSGELGVLLPLLCIPVLARSSILALFLSTPYARESGLAHAIALFLPRKTAAIICIFSLSALAYCLGPAFKATFISTGICFILLRRLMLQRINGYTGDTAGAMVEIIECASLLTLACVDNE